MACDNDSQHCLTSVTEYLKKLAGCQILLCAIIAIRQGIYFIWTLGVNAIQFWCATETANLSYEKIYQLETYRRMPGIVNKIKI